MRILVVDDEEDIVALLQEGLPLFVEGGAEVLAAASMDEAKELLRREDADVVLTDERMPGGSGTELLAWVAARKPGALRVLMTAFADADARRRLAGNPDVHLFVAKPFELAQLGRALRALLAASG